MLYQASFIFHICTCIFCSLTSSLLRISNFFSTDRRLALYTEQKRAYPPQLTLHILTLCHYSGTEGIRATFKFSVNCFKTDNTDGRLGFGTYWKNQEHKKRDVRTEQAWMARAVTAASL